jgi:hypothetical protein
MLKYTKLKTKYMNVQNKFKCLSIKTQLEKEWEARWEARQMSMAKNPIVIKKNNT